jgi:hypothetical protein
MTLSQNLTEQMGVNAKYALRYDTNVELIPVVFGLTSIGANA